MTVHREPTVAAILAARDAETTVGQAITSALGQTVAVTDIIVVSDGSVDSTASAARAALNGRGLVIELQSSIGRGAARNLAAEHTEADFLMICDADDVSEANRVEALIERWHETGASVIGGQARLATKSGRFYGRTHMPLTTDMCEALANAGEMPVVHPSCMIEHRAFKNLGGYDPALLRAQDLNLMIRLVQRGLGITNTDSVVVRYNYPLWLKYGRFCEEQEWADNARQHAGLDRRPSPTFSRWMKWNSRRMMRIAKQLPAVSRKGTTSS